MSPNRLVLAAFDCNPGGAEVACEHANAAQGFAVQREH